ETARDLDRRRQTAAGLARERGLARAGRGLRGGRLGRAALLLLQDRVADLDALVADVDARRPRDQRVHVVPPLLAERAALDVAAAAGGGGHDDTSLVIGEEVTTTPRLSSERRSRLPRTPGGGRLALWSRRRVCKAWRFPRDRPQAGSRILLRLPRPGDDLIDQTEVLGLLRRHEVVALASLRDFLDRLARVVGEDLLQGRLHLED